MTFLVDRLLRDRADVADIEDRPSRLRTALESESGAPAAATLVVDPAGLPTALDPVGRARNAESDELTARWLAVAAAAGDPDIDDEIDARLADDETAGSTIDALVRTGTDWYHPALVDALYTPETRFGAAWLLARTAPDELEEECTEIDEIPALVEMLRAAALAGDPEWFDRIHQWRDHLVEDVDDERYSSRLDGALATIDPDRYARLLLKNEVDDAWLGDDRAVADFITRHGTSEWLEPLAVFRHVRDTGAFELTAAFATAAAITGPFDDVDDDRLDPASARDWIDDDPRRCSYQLALTEETQLEELLVEATLHQALNRRGARPPAMTGLPLSGHPPEAGELARRIEPLRSLSMDKARDRLAVVRTLTDLHRLVRRNELSREDAAPVLEEFAPRGDAPALVATLLEQDQPVGRVDDWGTRGIAALAWSFDNPDTDSIDAIAARWFQAPLERVSLFRSAFSVTAESVFDTAA